MSSSRRYIDGLGRIAFLTPRRSDWILGITGTINDCLRIISLESGILLAPIVADNKCFQLCYSLVGEGNQGYGRTCCVTSFSHRHTEPIESSLTFCYLDQRDHKCVSCIRDRASCRFRLSLSNLPRLYSLTPKTRIPFVNRYRFVCRTRHIPSIRSHRPNIRSRNYRPPRQQLQTTLNAL
ncbi:hypothetical protein KCU76_g89, partial [Aureobasidium melanogenum]